MVKIDKNKCIGCHLCEKVCPEGFSVIDGLASITDDKAPCIEEAANACPRRAIIIEGEKRAPHTRHSISGYGMGRRGLRVRAGYGRGLGRRRGHDPERRNRWR
jgi:ferredoxin